MVKLHANMHGYRPDRALDWLRPAMKVCAKYNIVVLIHTGDGPYTIPTQFYPIIREFPMVNFIIGHFGIQTGGNYSFEAFWMAMDTPNVYCESGWCYQSRIVEFARELPRNKIVFGTDSPPNGFHVAARAGNAVPAPQDGSRRGRPRGLHGQQHRPPRRHRADQAAERSRRSAEAPHVDLPVTRRQPDRVPHRTRARSGLSPSASDGVHHGVQPFRRAAGFSSLRERLSRTLSGRRADARAAAVRRPGRHGRRRVARRARAARDARLRARRRSVDTARHQRICVPTAHRPAVRRRCERPVRRVAATCERTRRAGRRAARPRARSGDRRRRGRSRAAADDPPLRNRSRPT